MSFNETETQLLKSLAGRVEELELAKSSLEAYAKLSYVNKLFPLPGTANFVNNDIVLTNSSPSLIIVECIGIERTVTLPPANKGNRYFIIANNSNV